MGELLPKGNRQQTWLPISIWWLPNTQSGPTDRQTKPMSHHQKTPTKTPSAILLKHVKADC